MNAASLRGTVAQVCAFLMWGSDFIGHSAVGTILADPRTAALITGFIASGFQVWALAEHFYAAWVRDEQAKKLASVQSKLFAAKDQIAGH